MSTTALPYEYEIYAIYETSGKLEDKKLHKLIDNLNPDLRISKNREFFMMEPSEAYELLEAIALISGTQEKLKKVKLVKVANQHKKKPAVNFFECNIPVGSELIFIDDPDVKVVVVSDRKVEYENEITSLSAVANSIKGYRCAGPSYFTYKGKLVAEIAAETQWKE